MFFVLCDFNILKLSRTSQNANVSGAVNHVCYNFFMDKNGLIIKTFVAWTKVKIKAHLSDRTQFFREGEIWWVNLGYNVGFESNGKNNNFERPILVIKRFNKDSFWGIPMSTQIKIGTYYYTFSLQGRQYCLNLSQMRLLSSKRMLRNIDIMKSEDVLAVRQRMRDFF